jgi:hypothetical protein
MAPNHFHTDPELSISSESVVSGPAASGNLLEIQTLWPYLKPGTLGAGLTIYGGDSYVASSLRMA